MRNGKTEPIGDFRSYILCAPDSQVRIIPHSGECCLPDQRAVVQGPYVIEERSLRIIDSVVSGIFRRNQREGFLREGLEGFLGNRQGGFLNRRKCGFYRNRQGGFCGSRCGEFLRNDGFLRYRLGDSAGG